MDRQWYSVVFQWTKRWRLTTLNMAGSTLAAKRMVCDHVHSVGGMITSMLVTNNCCVLCKCSAQILYSAYLEDQKKHRSKVVAGEKRKALNDWWSKWVEVKRRALHCRLMLRLCLLQLMILQIISKRHATSSKKESRPPEGTEPVYRNWKTVHNLVNIKCDICVNVCKYFKLCGLVT